MINTCLHVSEIKKNRKLKFMYLEVYFKQGKGGFRILHRVMKNNSCSGFCWSCCVMPRAKWNLKNYSVQFYLCQYRKGKLGVISRSITVCWNIMAFHTGVTVENVILKTSVVIALFTNSVIMCCRKLSVNTCIYGTTNNGTGHWMSNLYLSLYKWCVTLHLDYVFSEYLTCCA